MIDTVTVLGVKHYDITLLDVGKIKSIYGDGGFDNQDLSKSGHQRVHQLSTDRQTYMPNETVTLRVNTNSFSERSFAEILVIDSNDNLIDNFGISKANYTISLNDEYQKNGTYWAELLNPTTGDYDYTKFEIGIKPTQTADSSQSSLSTPVISIPQWVKNNSKYWANNTLSDTDFVNGVKYLMDQGIMKTSANKTSSSQSNQIPKWIKNNARYWTDGTISDEEFIHAIQYLTDNGIIRIR